MLKNMGPFQEQHIQPGQCGGSRCRAAGSEDEGACAFEKGVVFYDEGRSVKEPLLVNTGDPPVPWREIEGMLKPKWEKLAA